MTSYIRRTRAHAAAIAILAAASCAAVPRGATAQEWGLLDAGSLFIGAGASRVGTQALDDHRAARAEPVFGQTGRAFSAGAHMILPGGVSLGAEWHGFDVGDAEHGGRDVGLGGGYGTIGIGYVFELSPRVRVYPRLGIGGGGMGLWMESDSGDVSFDDVVADPRAEEYLRDPVLSIGSGVIDLGVGAEFLPGGWARGLMFGARLGYVAAPSTSEWRLHGRDASGGPEVSLAGPYIRATLGVARRRQH